MLTDVREHEERGHSAQYLILIFLVCVATCGVFFSLGFLVGYNERGSHSVPATEVVTPPPVVPPTINSPDSAPATPQNSSARRTPANSGVETEVLSSGGGAGSNSDTSPRKPAHATPETEQPRATAKPAANSSAPSIPAGGEVGEGITLQVAALRNKQDAQHLVDILKSRGYPVFLVTPEYAQADDKLCRVQVGPFKNREDAEKVRNRLSQEGFKPFIRH